ncbi:COMM domain-containing protein 4-like [Clytia hemisphaerica]|uniref:COMM domain-containing protein 4-like n=1 Tax=Clytia hemisphaerica TaxID=252671 RepID=UPI0034D77158
MRFRFCGDLDCPDWVLVEIITLSKMSSVKMKLFCMQVMSHLLGGKIDYAKVEKLTSDAKYTEKDMKATIAAVDFIFSSAGKYAVDGDSLSNELQQLGLPKELATALCKVYGDKKDLLQDALKAKSMRISRLNSVDWRVDFVLGSSFINENDTTKAEVQLRISKQEDQEEKTISFTASEEKFQTLAAELRDVYKLMENLT